MCVGGRGGQAHVCPLPPGVGFTKQQNNETTKGKPESFCKSANHRKFTNARGEDIFVLLIVFRSEAHLQETLSVCLLVGRSVG